MATTPARVSIRYDSFKEFLPETPSPPTSPEPDESRIHSSLMRENPSTHNLAAFKSRSVHQLTINPLHSKEASSLRSLTTKKMAQESLPDIYRDSVKCMNQIIKVVLPKSKSEAQALFDEAEKVQKLQPEHRAKVLAALQL